MALRQMNRRIGTPLDCFQPATLRAARLAETSARTRRRCSAITVGSLSSSSCATDVARSACYSSSRRIGRGLRRQGRPAARKARRVETVLKGMSHSLLLVESKDEVAAPLSRALEREGYLVSRESTSQGALAQVESEPPIVTLICLGTAHIDGPVICRTLRSSGYRGGIIVIAGPASESERVAGLDAGADDHLSQPFGVAELLARIRAVRRRVLPLPVLTSTDSLVTPTGLTLEPHRARWAGMQISFTPKEYEVLAVLATHYDQVMPLAILADQVWGNTWTPDSKRIHITISRLRRKLRDAGVPDRLVSIRGRGIRLAAPDS